MTLKRPPKKKPAAPAKRARRAAKAKRYPLSAEEAHREIVMQANRSPFDGGVWGLAKVGFMNWTQTVEKQTKITKKKARRTLRHED
jgi:hypothetical protein